MDNVIFFNTITPAKGVMNISTIIILALVLIVPAVIVGAAIFSTKWTSISLTDKEVTVKTMFAGKKIPLENIIIDEVRSINLNENADYRVSIRTWGIGLPGFRSGWMRLKNGKKALVGLTDMNNVLLLPTKDFVVLFSMDRIDEFISKIKEVKS